MNKKVLKVQEHHKNMLILTAVAITVIAILAMIILNLFILQRGVVVNQVKDALSKISISMEDAKSSGNGYPVTVPGVGSVDKAVIVNGGGSFDGTSYCVTGISKTNLNISYYIESGNTTPKEGNCGQSATNILGFAPSGLTVSFVGLSQVGVTWNQIPYAESYRLQCALNSDFKDAITIDTATNSGACSGLLSGKKYYFRVSSNSDLGQGAWSGLVTANSL